MHNFFPYRLPRYTGQSSFFARLCLADQFPFPNECSTSQGLCGEQVVMVGLRTYEQGGQAIVYSCGVFVLNSDGRSDGRYGRRTKD